MRWRHCRGGSPFLYQHSLLWLFGLSRLEAADHMLARLTDVLRRYQRQPGVSPDCYAPRLTGQERALLHLFVDWESAAGKPSLERVDWIVTASGTPRTLAIVAALAELLHRHQSCTGLYVENPQGRLPDADCGNVRRRVRYRDGTCASRIWPVRRRSVNSPLATVTKNQRRMA